MSDSMYKEWNFWKSKNNFRIDFKPSLSFFHKDNHEKTLTEVFLDFKNYWQLDSDDSKKMFKEIELLSDKMLSEWRIKYTFNSIHVFEEYKI